jgi:FdhD protein
MSGSIPKKSRATGERLPALSRHPVRLRRRTGAEIEDWVAAEEPLEIRVQGIPYAVTLRTPGDDVELALGFLYAEGVVTSPEDVVDVTPLEDLPAESLGNVVDVRLRGAPGIERPAVPRLVTSACGLCGRQALEQVARRAPRLGAGPRVGSRLLAGLPDRLAATQTGFRVTGGVHAAALFDAAGSLLVAREDVGRHNAVDKVVGWALAEKRLPLSGMMLAVSGRAGFEIAQKAWCAGAPILVAVSAPSSLAVALAEEAGMTLLAFARGDSYNVYAGAERILDDDSGPDAV